MQKITPCLWFDTQAEEAARFYTSLFRNSKIGAITRYGEGMPGPRGQVMTVEFELDGQAYLALNGGPYFKLNEAMSLIVYCNTQAEVDEMWEKLSAGGEKSHCGWVKDKFGLSWQVTPAVLPELVTDKDPKKAERVMHALLQMTKLDIAALERAYHEA